jgi:hypothetical protein
MSTDSMASFRIGNRDPNPGGPRRDEIDAEMVEDQIDEEDDNPVDLEGDEAGFENENADFDVETDRRDADDGPDGYVTQLD